MTIASGLRSYLGRHHVDFEEVPHALTMSASDSAVAAHVELGDVAKGVLLRTGSGYMLAVVPASCQVDLKELREWLGRDVTFASEDEVEEIFADCIPGAIPPIGAAYDLETIVDDRLLDKGDIYFEGGDHTTLVHVNGAEWLKMMRKVPHRMISH